MSEIQKTMFEIWRKKGESLFSELAEEDWHVFDRLKELFIEYARLDELETQAMNSGNIKEAEAMRDRMTALFEIGKEK